MRNTKIKYKHPYTVWENIKADIEMDIISDKYNIGERVPSINQISKIYNVSNNTAVKVLESLRNDGVIMKRRGVGYFVMPYAKEILSKKRKIDFEGDMIKTLSVAQKLGYKQEEFVEFILTHWNKVSSNK